MQLWVGSFLHACMCACVHACSCVCAFPCLNWYSWSSVWVSSFMSEIRQYHFRHFLYTVPQAIQATLFYLCGLMPECLLFLLLSLCCWMLQQWACLNLYRLSFDCYACMSRRSDEKTCTRILAVLNATFKGLAILDKLCPVIPRGFLHVWGLSGVIGLVGNALLCGAVHCCPWLEAAACSDKGCSRSSTELLRKVALGCQRCHAEPPSWRTHEWTSCLHALVAWDTPRP